MSMIKQHSIVLGLLLDLAAPLSAFAQCSGQAPATTYCGNPTGSTALPGWKPMGGFVVDLDVGSTTITGGAAGRVLYDNGPGVLGEYAAVPLAFGGTNAALTASLGGIFYSTGSAGAILSGTATARQMLQSGASAAPAWSTATWPATTTINQMLYSSAANTVAGLPTGANGVLVTDSSGAPSISTSLPNGTLATTQTYGDNTAKVATTAFVQNQNTGGITPQGSACDGTSDDTAAIQAAVNQAGNNGTVTFRANCIYKITSEITVPYNYHYWVGGGAGSTQINISPTATIVGISFANGANSVDFTGISGIKFYCTENIHQKTVISVADARTFTLTNVAVSGAGVGVSGASQCQSSGAAVGLHTYGREFISTDVSSQIAAQLPVVIDKNPNSFLDFDHSEINSTLIADNNSVISAAAGIFMSNATFSGSWNGGASGFFWANTTSSVTSYNLRFVDIRSEQGQNSSAYTINIDGGSSNQINGISIENVNLDSARNGIRLRNTVFASISDTIYMGTTGIGLSINNTVGNLNLTNTFWNVGSTASIGAGINRIYAGPTVPATGPLPGTAYYSTRSPDFNADVLSTGVAGSLRGQINLCGNTSGCALIRPQPVAGTAQIDVPLVSGPITTNATAPLTLDPVNGTMAMSGLSALSQGDLIYGSASNTFSRLTKDTNSTRYLSNTGTSNNPAWAQVNLSNGVTGTLPLANGGTNATTAQGAAANLAACWVKQSWVQVTHTGDTNEFALATIQIPANSIGPNGSVRITQLITYTNSANTKTFRTRFGGVSGTSYNTMAVTTTATGRYQSQIGNRNSTNSQVGFASGVGVGSTGATWGFTTGAVVTSAVDTTASVDIVLTGTNSNSGETVALEGYSVEICYGA